MPHLRRSICLNWFSAHDLTAPPQAGRPSGDPGRGYFLSALRAFGHRACEAIVFGQSQRESMNNVKTTRYSPERLGLVIVAGHLLVSLVHGAAHSSLHIEMETWQSVYILAVITLLPLVSGFLLWRRMPGGFLLLLCSMMGGLAFGGYYHFIAVGSDNVSSLGAHSWALPFQVTAILLALIETAGVITGIVGLIKK